MGNREWETGTRITSIVHGRLRLAQVANSVHVNSQIYFILSHTNWKACNENARSYAGTITNSDNRLVTAQFKLIWAKTFKKPKNNKNINVTHLKSL